MFDQASQLTRISPTSFGAHADDTWLQGRGQFGGLCVAWLVRAFNEVVDEPSRRPRTITAHLAAPVPHGDVTIHVEVVRQGNYVTQLRGEIRSGDVVCVTALGTWAVDRDRGPQIDLPTMAAMPAPHTLPAMPRAPYLPVFTQHVDYRFALGSPPYQGSTEATLGGWARFAAGATPDDVMIAGLFDVWPPAVLATLNRPTPAATVDITLHFLQPVDPHAARDAFYGARLHTAWASHGYAEEHADLWDNQGRLLARMRQWCAVIEAKR